MQCQARVRKPLRCWPVCDFHLTSARQPDHHLTLTLSRKKLYGSGCGGGPTKYRPYLRVLSEVYEELRDDPELYQKKLSLNSSTKDSDSG